MRLHSAFHMSRLCATVPFPSSYVMPHPSMQPDNIHEDTSYLPFQASMSATYACTHSGHNPHAPRPPPPSYPPPTHAMHRVYVLRPPLLPAYAPAWAAAAVSSTGPSMVGSCSGSGTRHTSTRHAHSSSDSETYSKRGHSCATSDGGMNVRYRNQYRRTYAIGGEWVQRMWINTNTKEHNGDYRARGMSADTSRGIWHSWTGNRMRSMGAGAGMERILDGGEARGMHTGPGSSRNRDGAGGESEGGAATGEKYGNRRERREGRQTDQKEAEKDRHHDAHQQHPRSPQLSDPETEDVGLRSGYQGQGVGGTDSDSYIEHGHINTNTGYHYWRNPSIINDWNIKKYGEGSRDDVAPKIKIGNLEIAVGDPLSHFKFWKKTSEENSEKTDASGKRLIPGSPHADPVFELPSPRGGSDPSFLGNANFPTKTNFRVGGANASRGGKEGMEAGAGQEREGEKSKGKSSWSSVAPEDDMDHGTNEDTSFKTDSGTVPRGRARYLYILHDNGTVERRDLAAGGSGNSPPGKPPTVKIPFGKNPDGSKRYIEFPLGLLIFLTISGILLLRAYRNRFRPSPDDILVEAPEAFTRNYISGNTIPDKFIPKYVSLHPELQVLLYHSGRSGLQAPIIQENVSGVKIPHELPPIPDETLRSLASPAIAPLLPLASAPPSPRQESFSSSPSSSEFVHTHMRAQPPLYADTYAHSNHTAPQALQPALPSSFASQPVQLLPTQHQHRPLHPIYIATPDTAALASTRPPTPTSACLSRPHFTHSDSTTDAITLYSALDSAQSPPHHSSDPIAFAAMATDAALARDLTLTHGRVALSVDGLRRLAFAARWMEAGMAQVRGRGTGGGLRVGASTGMSTGMSMGPGVGKGMVAKARVGLGTHIGRGTGADEAQGRGMENDVEDASLGMVSGPGVSAPPVHRVGGAREESVGAAAPPPIGTLYALPEDAAALQRYIADEARKERCVGARGAQAWVGRDEGMSTRRQGDTWARPGTSDDESEDVESVIREEWCSSGTWGVGADNEAKVWRLSSTEVEVGNTDVNMGMGTSAGIFTDNQSGMGRSRRCMAATDAPSHASPRAMGYALRMRAVEHHLYDAWTTGEEAVKAEWELAERKEEERQRRAGSGKGGWKGEAKGPEARGRGWLTVPPTTHEESENATGHEDSAHQWQVFGKIAAAEVSSGRPAFPYVRSASVSRAHTLPHTLNESSSQIYGEYVDQGNLVVNKFPEIRELSRELSERIRVDAGAMWLYEAAMLRRLQKALVDHLMGRIICQDSDMAAFFPDSRISDSGRTSCVKFSDRGLSVSPPSDFGSDLGVWEAVLPAATSLRLNSSDLRWFSLFANKANAHIVPYLPEDALTLAARIPVPSARGYERAAMLNASTDERSVGDVLWCSYAFSLVATAARFSRGVGGVDKSENMQPSAPPLTAVDIRLDSDEGSNLYSQRYRKNGVPTAQTRNITLERPNAAVAQAEDVCAQLQAEMEDIVNGYKSPYAVHAAKWLKLPGLNELSPYGRLTMPQGETEVPSRPPHIKPVLGKVPSIYATKAEMSHFWNSIVEQNRDLLPHSANNTDKDPATELVNLLKVISKMANNAIQRME